MVEVPCCIAATPRRRFLRPAVLVTALAAIAVLATGFGLKIFAHGHGFGGWHRSGLMGAHLDPARLDEHLDHKRLTKASGDAKLATTWEWRRYKSSRQCFGPHGRWDT